MSATTDARSPRPALWSKLVAAVLSAGALLGITQMLNVAAQDRANPPSAGTRSGDHLRAVTIAPVAPAPAPAPAQVQGPAAASAPIAPVAPHAVSRGSGG